MHLHRSVLPPIIFGQPSICSTTRGGSDGNSGEAGGFSPVKSWRSKMPPAQRVTVEGVALSHPDKVLFEAQGLTKADIAAHYVRVAERMLPWMRNRLVSLVRCPD